MFRRSRLKSKTTMRSCKLLILLMITVSAMSVATDYLKHWLPTRNASRSTESGIISAGCPDYLRRHLLGHDKLHPLTGSNNRLLNHIPSDDKPNFSNGGGHTAAHELYMRYQASSAGIVTKLWQAALQPPIILAHAIRLIRVEAPSSVEVGKPIKLKCSYELRNEKLQSLAWYKNGREFYRYQPFERRQPVLTFSLNGINVDMSRSKNSTVHLTNATMETSGRYKCEATSTTFREANQEVTIRVTEPDSSGVPRTKPDSSIWILPYLTATLAARMIRPNQERNHFYIRRSFCTFTNY